MSKSTFYILTASGRRVTPTARPLYRDDVLYQYEDGIWKKYKASGVERLHWERFE